MHSCLSLAATFLALVSLATLSTAERLVGRVLIYSRTLEYRHDSIPTAIQALKEKGPSYNILFDATEDPKLFTDENLSQYDALFFLHTTGDVLNGTNLAAFQKYLDLGGNFVGVHAASACLYTTPFYGKELGAWFTYHPVLQNATVNVLDHSHPSTSMLPDRWHIQEEMYNFDSDPRKLGAIVLLSADESTYVDTAPHAQQGTPHPSAWYQERGAGIQAGGVAGRSFYTSLGHLNETWQDNLFMSHVMGGLSWAIESNTTRFSDPDAQVGSTEISNYTIAVSSTATSSTPTASATSTANSKSSGQSLSLTPFALLSSASAIALGALALLA
ncbi:hypothetical protein JAAARDRAFT_36238 [Jaapia argillacea MUCL 33604]|uniref:ThuA-like domain-containing protein n=1 Tax=Jaapia argillacea MUCL 33604 TaxID=933084 RepID=A0A067PPL8_9AGAM|nr:hypothetical protein JAAARDRAFT_36238 [Jaapia argillacea MUCL 33604]